MSKPWFSKFVGVALLAGASLLTGCFEDIPNSKLVEKEIETVTNQDLEGLSKTAFKVSDLVRVNGWKDQDRYLIKYTYNLASTADYDQLLVTMYKEHINQIKAESEEERNKLFASIGMLQTWGWASDNINVGLVKRDREYLQDKSSFLDFSKEYWNENAGRSDAKKIMTAIFYTARVSLDGYNFPFGAAQGTKIPREVTMVFRKTEKGWARFASGNTNTPVAEVTQPDPSTSQSAYNYNSTQATQQFNSHSDQTLPPPVVVNPSTGYPMVGNSTAGVDVGGNAYGTNRMSPTGM